MSRDVIIPSPQEIAERVKNLKEWLSNEPHLPKIDDSEWLKTFLYHNKFSLEKTKSKLEKYYSYRSKYPEILKNRDPTAPELMEVRQCARTAFAEKRTKDGDFVMFVKYEANAKDFDITAYSKRVFMVLDLTLLNTENRLARSVSVVDLQHFSSLHALKFMMGAPKMGKILNGAYPESTKAVHLINFPPFMKKVIDLLLKYFSKKLSSRIRVHAASSETLFEAVDRDIVCSDFGGSGPSLAELEERTQQELEKRREWFAEQESVCSDKRLKKKKLDQVEEISDAFGKLEVD